MATALRYKVERSSCLSRYLHQLGWAIFTEPTHDAENLPAHVHKTAYEICYIVHGVVDWWVEDRVFEVGPGEMFMTFPGEKHGGLHDIMNPCELFWVQIELPHRGCLPGLARQETVSLADKLANIQDRHFPGTAEILVLFRRIIDEHRYSSAHSAILVRTALIDIVIAVLRGYEIHRQKGATTLHHSKPICAALNLIDQRFVGEIRMEEIAHTVGLSTGAFYRRFHEEVGMPPGEYLTQRRIHRAKILLCDPALSVTAIAHTLGYSSSQYFSTIFKRVTGVSPSAYHATKLRETAADPAFGAQRHRRPPDRNTRRGHQSHR